MIDAASGAVAGTLFVQPRVGDGEGALLDDVVAPRFLLATIDEQAQSWLSAASLDIWRRIGGERAVISQDAMSGQSPDGIHRLRERGRLFADWMARNSAAAVVARPDRYVYGIARDADELNRMIEGLGRQVFGES